MSLAGTPPAFRIPFKFKVEDKQAAPVSVPLCEQCHGQVRLNNSFPGYPLQADSYLQMYSFSQQRY